MSLREPGLWVARYGDRDLRGRSTLFLDRDGTIMADVPYLGDPSGVSLKAPVVGLMRAVAAAGHPLVIVTNQSGIARGLIGWRDFEEVTARLFELLAAAGCPPDAVIACAYFASNNPMLNAPDHSLRKPNPGMLHLAAREWGIDLAGSVIAGDRSSDMLAGVAAGLRTGLLVGDAEAAPHFDGFTMLCPDRTATWPQASAAVRDALRRPESVAGS